MKDTCLFKVLLGGKGRFFNLSPKVEQYFKSFQRVGDKFENSSVQSLMKLLAKVANKC